MTTDDMAVAETEAEKEKQKYENNKVKGLKGNCMLINLFEVENFNINFACFSSARE
jgi:hypothetical protein